MWTIERPRAGAEHYCTPSRGADFLLEEAAGQEPEHNDAVTLRNAVILARVRLIPLGSDQISLAHGVRGGGGQKHVPRQSKEDERAISGVTHMVIQPPRQWTGGAYCGFANLPIPIGTANSY